MEKTYKQYLKKYLDLLEDFTNGKIGAPKFEENFLEFHRNDNHLYEEDVHIVLSILFSDVDSYCSIPELRDEGDLDDEELLQKARIAFIKLKSL